MTLPSLKSLEAAFPGKGKVLRQLLTSSKAVHEHPAVIEWAKQCWHDPKLKQARMHALNAELECHGVEYVAPGKNARSPGFEYYNTGAYYAATIVRFDDGRYRISDIGTIIEKGNYE